MATKKQDVDAFPDEEATSTDDAVVERLEDFGAKHLDGPDGFEGIEMGATLQDAKVSASERGDNYELTFEVGVEGFIAVATRLAGGKGSFSATWNKLHVGNGAEVKRLASARDADGEAHFKMVVHLPQSEISRSLGRMGTALRKHALLKLEPEQGELGLADGTSVDLTTRAN